VAGEFFRLLLAGTGDPVLLIGAPAVLAAVALIACYAPARELADLLWNVRGPALLDAEPDHP
jgi:hypothetical protein